MKALPRFSVGEIVILQSLENPEMNGEDTVIEIVRNLEYTEDRVFGGLVKLGLQQPIAYKLERAIITTKSTKSGREVEGVWGESALRKKQEPGEMSFMQLMGSLNIEEKV